MRDADGRMLTQSVGRDITERRQAEDVIAGAQRKAEAASAAKSRFLATVSHELRTPLSGVMGMADLLIDTGLTPEQATYARAVKSSGESLLSLIDEILDFSKIESGKLELAAENFDLSALVEGVAELIAPRAQDKGLEIASFITPRTPRQLLGDPARLRQVLLNLAGTAVKFSSHGGVGVSVSLSAQGRILFEVADTGEGIAPDRLERIFEEFEQGEGVADGAGLGLAISRSLVEMMGGSLKVESRPGRGSTFTAEIPLASVAVRAAASGLVPGRLPRARRGAFALRSPLPLREAARARSRRRPSRNGDGCAGAARQWQRTGGRRGRRCDRRGGRARHRGTCHRARRGLAPHAALALRGAGSSGPRPLLASTATS